MNKMQLVKLIYLENRDKLFWAVFIFFVVCITTIWVLLEYERNGSIQIYGYISGVVVSETMTMSPQSKLVIETCKHGTLTFSPDRAREPKIGSVVLISGYEKGITNIFEVERIVEIYKNHDNLKDVCESKGAGSIDFG